MFDTMQKAIPLMESLVQKQNEESLHILLQDLQASMIELGNWIEHVYGTSTKSVETLERLCETIYQITILDTESKKTIIQTMKIQMWDLHRFMEAEIDNKVEIIFMPYKYSMWDSLESVYYAAKADPRCNVYCMPIPYYTRNADGSFGEFHCEGKLFEKTVEVVDWETFDLAKRCPDIVYIHNPYDGHNYVTSIHPDFYTQKLKTYVGEVVYIPYFVLDSDTVKKKEIMPFAMMPGVLYADKVILQSERICNLYKECYQDLLLHNGIVPEEEILQNKFLNMGSPKIEKALNEQIIDLPSAWKEKIYNESGKKKKVIFYNTGVSEILNLREKLLYKMEWVFKQFQMHQDDFVLLWRPHPLIIETIKSMRWELLEQYEKLRDWYIQNEIGIYDDGIELDVAVKISDGYYGAYSSVAELFKAEGKRVLFHTDGCYQDKENMIPEYYFMVEDRGKLFFSCANYSMMGWLDTKCKKIHALPVKSYVNLDKECGIASMVNIEGTIFFLVQNMICSYHIHNNVFQREISLGTDIEYVRMYQEKENLYLISFSGYQIVAYNVKTKKVTYLDSFEEQYRRLWGQNESPSWMSENYYIYKDTIYYLMYGSPTIVAIDTKQNCVKLYALKGNCSDRGIAFCGHADNLYRISEDGDVIEWNIESHQERIVVHLSEQYYRKSDIIGDMRWYGQRLWLFNRYGIQGVSISVINGQMQQLSEYPMLADLKGIITAEDILVPRGPSGKLIWGCHSGDIVSLDLNTGEYTRIFCAEKLDWQNFIGYEPDKLSAVNKESFSGLVCLNSMFFEYSFDEKCIQEKNESCGKKIHEYILSAGGDT